MTYEGFAVDDDLFLRVLDAARAPRLHRHGACRKRRRDPPHAQAADRARPYRHPLSRRGTQRDHGARSHASRAGAGRDDRRAHDDRPRVLLAVGARRSNGPGSAASTSSPKPARNISSSAPRDLDRPARDAARFVFSPPPRSPRSHALSLAGAWPTAASTCGRPTIRPITSPTRSARPRRPASTTTLSGIPGLETRLPLLFSEGLADRPPVARPLSRPDLAQRRRDLRPRRIARAASRSVSMRIWRCGIRAASGRIGHAVLHSRVDFSPYEGRQVTGKPITVLVRGVPVIADEKLAGRAGLRRIRAALAVRSRIARQTCRGDDAMARYLTIAVCQTGPDPEKRATRRDGRPARRVFWSRRRLPAPRSRCFPRWR